MKKYALFQYENLNFQFFPKVLLRFGVVAEQHQTLANLTKTSAKKSKIKISYRNNAYFFIHHRVISKHHLVVVYTKFEVKRSILEGCRPIQQISPQNPVFETLTTAGRTRIGVPSRSTGETTRGATRVTVEPVLLTSAKLQRVCYLKTLRS